ncbi:MAG: CCA tRNA nucleotidyltransferase [Anaerolineaceae bacterium]|nr:CCA tRNA nucleotidyltransferase [Anaerolineaceae bacterium]
MNFIDSPILQQVSKISQANPAETGPVYLVGGAVRDLLLQYEPHDLDFTMHRNVRSFAKKVADLLGGAFYMLDEERDTARVLYNDPKRGRFSIDFASLRGADIHADLKNRDFTINAMAVAVHDCERLIDPLNGAQDLKDKVLRICSNTALHDDPVRTLRAARLTVQMDLHITPETLKALRRAVPLLATVTVERRRDELFKILDGEKPHTAFQLMDILGMLPFLVPELELLKDLKQPAPHVFDVWEHTLAALREMTTLFSFLVGDYQEEANNLMVGLAVLRLGRYRVELAKHFEEWLNPNRSRRSLLAFGLLYHDSGKASTISTDEEGRLHFYEHEHESARLVKSRARELALSQAEGDYLKTLVGNHMRLHHLINSNVSELSRRTKYRYFRATGAVGIDMALLSLADTLATWQTTLQPDLWQRELDLCRWLFDTWWGQNETVVRPRALITGRDILEHFNLEAGPKIGIMLEVVREAQASGELESSEEAFKLLEEWLATQ